MSWIDVEAMIPLKISLGLRVATSHIKTVVSVLAVASTPISLILSIAVIEPSQSDSNVSDDIEPVFKRKQW